jgi:orotate phosphoribosyltransferase
MSNRVLEILKAVGAIITDSHFVLTSGRHAATYINKDALYPHTQQTSQICMLFAEKCKDIDVDVVVAPAQGGIILSQWTAFHLSEMKNKEILSVYAAKNSDKTFSFTRGYDQIIASKNVLVVEDTTTTGTSIKSVIDAVEAVEGRVVAACVMVNRNPKRVNSDLLGVPLYSLAVLEIEDYTEENLPAELMRRPINMEFGHGKKHLGSK